MSTRVEGVAAIVVTYNPERQKLEALLEATTPQVEKVIIVDNGSLTQRAWLRETAVARGAELVLSDRNVGVAAGHNLGTARAAAMGADTVLLLDQDSVPAANMVRELRRALETLDLEGVRVAAVGPAHFDAKRGIQSPFIRFGFLRNQHLYCNGVADSPAIRCDHLITSGTLIPLDALNAIGPMDEELFVDNVDTEWCFRAVSKGFALYGVCAARMTHEVGDALLDIWVPSSDPVVIHAPIRLYYIFRNHLLLYGRRSTPVRWTIQDIPRLAFKAAIFSTTVSPRLNNLSMILKGLRDGIRGQTGSFAQR